VPYSIEYFHPRVLAETESWPSDILADYGPNLRLPHLRAFGGGLFRKRMREVLHG